jgi:hypothetical protein
VACLCGKYMHDALTCACSSLYSQLHRSKTDKLSQSGSCLNGVEDCLLAQAKEFKDDGGYERDLRERTLSERLTKMRPPPFFLSLFRLLNSQTCLTASVRASHRSVAMPQMQANLIAHEGLPAVLLRPGALKGVLYVCVCVVI